MLYKIEIIEFISLGSGENHNYKRKKKIPAAHKIICDSPDCLHISLLISEPLSVFKGAESF